LTPRETEILRLIAEGVGNAEIAQRLALGLGTVKDHVRDILEKLSAADRAQRRSSRYAVDLSDANVKHCGGG